MGFEKGTDKGAPAPEVIRAARLVAGLTQAQLAKELGVTEHSVANWENGRRNITYAAWRILSDLEEAAKRQS